MMKKEGSHFPWVNYYLHRWLRLTPVYLFVMFFYVTLFANVGTGPNWRPDFFAPSCGIWFVIKTLCSRAGSLEDYAVEQFTLRITRCVECNNFNWHYQNKGPC
jgi:hypothetical protein